MQHHLCLACRIGHRCPRDRSNNPQCTGLSDPMVRFPRRLGASVYVYTHRAICGAMTAEESPTYEATSTLVLKQCQFKCLYPMTSNDIKDHHKQQWLRPCGRSSKPALWPLSAVSCLALFPVFFYYCGVGPQSPFLFFFSFPPKKKQKRNFCNFVGFPSYF